MGARVYLAGPITGLSYGEARHGWREEAARIAAQNYPQLDMFSPMRSKDFLERTRKIKGTSDSYGSAIFGQASGILGRDFNDCKNADVIIANFLGAKVGSLGTAAEFGFAHALQIPVIMIIEEPDDPELKTNPHRHVFMEEIATYIVHDLEDALMVAASLVTKGI